MDKIQRENFRTWLTALRGGEYKQGRGRLRIPETDFNGNVKEMTYCCLGVACDVAYPEKWQNVTEFGTGRASFLPPAWLLTEYYGIPEEMLTQGGNVMVQTGGGFVAVSTLNDLWGYDFHQIADLLESTYLTHSEEPRELVHA